MPVVSPPSGRAPSLHLYRLRPQRQTAPPPACLPPLAWPVALTYTCESWPQGRRTTSTSSSACGRRCGHSGGTPCASCCGAYRSCSYPWSEPPPQHHHDELPYRQHIYTWFITISYGPNTPPSPPPSMSIGWASWSPSLPWSPGLRATGTACASRCRHKTYQTQYRSDSPNAAGDRCGRLARRGRRM